MKEIGERIEEVIFFNYNATRKMEKENNDFPFLKYSNWNKLSMVGSISV